MEIEAIAVVPPAAYAPRVSGAVPRSRAADRRDAREAPVLVVPQGMAAQPVDTGEVASRLALDQPAGRIPDFGGPGVWNVAEATRAYLATAGLHRKVIRGCRCLVRRRGRFARDGI